MSGWMGYELPTYNFGLLLGLIVRVNCRCQDSILLCIEMQLPFVYLALYICLSITILLLGNETTALVLHLVAYFLLNRWLDAGVLLCLACLVAVHQAIFNIVVH
jgi:hypothetical protein